MLIVNPGAVTIPTSSKRAKFEVPFAAPFDPATIANLALFLQYDAAHCTSSTPGQPVSAVSASYGTTRTASAAGGARPTFRANGLEYDGASSQVMDLSSALVLNAAFTLYSVFNVPAGADLFAVGSVSTPALIGLAGGTITALDDAGGGPTLASLTGLSLIRLSVDGVGSCSFKATGAQSGVGTVGVTTLEVIGASPNNTAFSGSTANRSLCDIIKTGDNSGTAEDANILAWLLATYGATLS